MRQPNILDYLPEVFKTIREIIAHANAENPELAAAWERVENAYNDQFLYTMTENGISRWESMLNIVPMGTDTLEDRRFRIINRLNAQLPYTYKMLESHLVQMCGEDGYTMEYISATWTLKVRVALGQKKQYDEILDLIKKMIPQNLLLDYDLLYNTYEILSAFTHGDLSEYTHEQLRSESIA